MHRMGAREIDRFGAGRRDSLGTPKRALSLTGRCGGRFLEATVGRASLHFGVEPGKSDVVADVFTQPADVFNGHEDAIALRILEVQVLARRSIRCFQLARADISAKPMSGMQNQLAWKEGGSELRWHVSPIYTLLGPFSNIPAKGRPIRERPGRVDGAWRSGWRRRWRSSPARSRGDREGITAGRGRESLPPRPSPAPGS